MDKRGKTDLHVAIENGMVDTSLHLAAIHGHYRIVNNLLDDIRVDKNAMNTKGFTVIKIIE